MPGSSPRRGRSLTARAVALVAALVVGAPAKPASAQFSDPCQVRCALVLGASAYTIAIGTVVGYGRATRGYSTRDVPLAIWGTTFAVVVVGGMALSGNGERQERAVYASGIGALGGALVGLALGPAFGEGDRSSKLAAVLVGAAAGAVVSGVYGALSYGEGAAGARPATIGVRIPF
jgi:hypothetical protein